MANFYADRVSAVYGGLPLDGVEFSNFRFSTDIGLQFVDTMTDDYSTPGYVRGNTKVQGSFTLKIPAGSTLPAIETINPQSQNVEFIATVASTQFGDIEYRGMSWILSNCVVESSDIDFSGPGREGESNYTFKALSRLVVPATT